jgi:hypothetical protein
MGSLSPLAMKTLGVHNVLGYLSYGRVVERAEDDPLGAAAVQVLDRAEEAVSVSAH